MIQAKEIPFETSLFFEWASYHAIIQSEKPTCPPWEFWEKHSNTTSLKGLYQLAKKYLCMPLSSSSPERTSFLECAQSELGTSSEHFSQDVFAQFNHSLVHDFLEKLLKESPRKIKEISELGIPLIPLSFI